MHAHREPAAPAASGRRDGATVANSLPRLKYGTNEVGGGSGCVLKLHYRSLPAGRPLVGRGTMVRKNNRRYMGARSLDATLASFWDKAPRTFAHVSYGSFLGGEKKTMRLWRERWLLRFCAEASCNGARVVDYGIGGGLLGAVLLNSHNISHYTQASTLRSERGTRPHDVSHALALAFRHGTRPSTSFLYARPSSSRLP